MLNNTYTQPISILPPLFSMYTIPFPTSLRFIAIHSSGQSSKQQYQDQPQLPKAGATSMSFTPMANDRALSYLYLNIIQLEDGSLLVG